VGTWTFARIPPSADALFGRKGQFKVKGSIDGYPYRSSARPFGDGTHYVVVNQVIRAAIGASAGARVQVVMELDTEPRAVTLPDDVRRVFTGDEPARAAFESLSYSRQKELVDWIKAAKKLETRNRRVVKALEHARAGRSPKA
jgi:hypothetical protein